MSAQELVTLEEWRRSYPERWARIEGTLTRNEYRTLKFLDPQIYVAGETKHGTASPDSPEVRWLRRCIVIYLYACAHGFCPKDDHSLTWVKNQRRGALCDYQVAALQQIPGWRWAPRRSSWNERAEQLNTFREEFGREPRVRSVWDVERALAHWHQRQRSASIAGKLTPRQTAMLEGDTSVPTGELAFRIAGFAGSYQAWFQEFWVGVQAFA